jgi:HD-GYP domain-containing protein (c-di-GMP phosphodiesterase class II)
MGIFEDLRSGLTPAVEELHEGWDRIHPTALRGRELAVEAASATAFLATAVAMAALIPSDQTSFDPLLALTLVASYAVLARIRFPVGYGFTIPTQLVLVPMLFLVPVGTVPLLVAVGMTLGTLPEYLTGDRHPSRILVGLGDAWHAVGPAAVVGAAALTAPGLGDWPVLVLALAAQLSADGVSATIREWAGHGISPRLQPSLIGWVTLVDVLLSPVGLLAAMAAIAEPYAVLLVLPLAVLLFVFSLERSARVRQAIELSRAYRGTTLLLSDVLEEDDEYTGFHSRSVVSLSVAVADTMGLSSKQRRNVEFGALLHDVGKIAIPKEIINKPGPLTQDEWLVIKTHTVEGQKMLDRVGGLLSEVGQIVRSSHEKWDGSGYPDGLEGDAIPVESAIVSCCDAFNAMTTDRSYRAAMSVDEALAEVVANAGTQFSPSVVEALMRVLNEDPLAAGARAPRAVAAA